MNSYQDGFRAGYLEGARMALDVVARIPAPDPENPGLVLDHPSPAVVYHPERVGFYRMAQSEDRSAV